VTVCECRKGQVSKIAERRLFLVSNLEALKGLTFERFKPRGRVGTGEQQAKSLELAYNHAHMFAENPQGWLLLQGGYGCGKTHLAAAIANQAIALGIPTHFITVPDLLDWLRFAFDSRESSFEQRFDEIRTVNLLVLDDFGTQNATPWAQEKLFQILNHRYINRLPLVVTTNLALEEIEGRIRSRLVDPELVTPLRMLAPDYRNPKEEAGHHELSTLGLHADKTFGSFSLRYGEGVPLEDLKTLEDAFHTAQAFAENPQGWLVLSGKSGRGKTHLAAAIGNYRASLGLPPLLVVVPDLLDHLRATFNPNSSVSLDHRFEEVRTTPLLILDDLGTQSSTPWAKEKLFQLFNYRYVAELPTVITTSHSLNEIEDRLRTRMMDQRVCRFLSLTVPEFYGVSYKKGAKKPPPGRGRPS